MINFKFFFDNWGKLICLFTLILYACENVPEHCSDGNRFDPKTQFCFENKAWKKCDGGEYNPIQEFCSEDDKVFELCGGRDYNPAAHTCENGIIKINEYIVTLDANGGSVTPTSLTAAHGQTLAQLSLPTPERAEYSFDGWYTSATDGIKYLNNYAVTDNVTLYAQWTCCTVTYNVNDGSGTVPTAQTVNAGSGVTLANGSGLTRSGYKFDGWNTNSEGTGTNYSAGSSYTPAGNITLYAKWTKLPPNSFLDSRDGQVYKYVTIGSQIWMAENLNYAGEDGDIGVCYGNADFNCDICGRLYKWNEVMDISSSYNSRLWKGNDEKHQGICPFGWHISNNAEWNVLMTSVGGVFSDQGGWGWWDGAGTELKSKTGWYTGSDYIPGTDEHGFSALPCGFGSDGGFLNGSNYGLWWSATEGDPDYALGRSMGYVHGDVDEAWDVKTNLLSLRCIMDE